jgi:asparagine synthase (glutamine-hydrolysing)
VQTFSIGFGDPSFDEGEHGRAVAAHYGTDHREFVVEATDLAVLPELARVFDEPFADASAIPGHLLARMTAEHVTVALTGDGADESFGGHERYAQFEQGDRLPVLAQLRPAFALVGSGIVRRTSARTLPGRVGRAVEVLGYDPAQRYGRMMSCFTSAEKIGLYTPAFAERLAGVETYDLFQQAYDTSASVGLGRIMEVDVQTSLPGGVLTRVDTTTMAHSLEARSPLLDHRLMEWAAGLPVSYKVQSGTTQRLLKEAMRSWLPAEVIDRPQRGLEVPLASWLRTDLKDLSHDVLTDSTATARGLFRPEVVQATLAGHAAGDDHSRKLWGLIQFELWARARVTSETVGPNA